MKEAPRLKIGSWGYNIINHRISFIKVLFNLHRRPEYLELGVYELVHHYLNIHHRL